MPDSPTGGEPEVLEPPVPRSSPPADKKKITCEFCECQIATSSGDVVKMSEKSRHLRDVDEENTSLRHRIEVLSGQIEKLETEKKELETKISSLPQPREKEAKEPKAGFFA